MKIFQKLSWTLSFCVLVCISHQKFTSAQQKEQYKQTFFFCDFDSNDCGGVLFTNNSDPNTEFAIESSQEMVSTFVTDYSSISRPTGNSATGPFNGPTCRIPWQLGLFSKINYFCDFKFECLISDYEFCHCQQGKFLWGRTNTQDNFYAKIMFPSIDIGEEHEFEISLYYFIQCDSPPCYDVSDRIQLFISSNAGNLHSTLYLYPHIFTGWKKYTARFDDYFKSIDYLEIQFVRDTSSSSVGFFAVDEIEVYKIIPTNSSVTTTTQEPSTNKVGTSSIDLKIVIAVSAVYLLLLPLVC